MKDAHDLLDETYQAVRGASRLWMNQTPMSETHGRDQVHRIMVKQNGAIFSKTMLRRMCFEVSQNFAMIFRSLLPQLCG